MPAAGDPADAVVDPEAEAFDRICRRLAGFDDRLDTEWVDGYLAALAASWRAIGLDEWLPKMAADAFERAFADPQDVAQATRALQDHYSGLRRALDPAALLDDPDRLRLTAWMTEWDEAARAELVRQGSEHPRDLVAYHTGAVWAMGFQAATDDFAADWPQPAADDPHAGVYASLRAAVEMLALAPQDERFVSHARQRWPDAPPTRDELIDDALFAAQDLRLWWLEHAPRGVPYRAAARPGRNDPCPCGSGRKYKKCHGAGA